MYRLTNFCSLIILIGSFVFFPGKSIAQITGNCKVSITTEIKGKLYKLESNEASLTLNSKSGDLMLRMELKSIDSELDTLDNYLDATDDELVFSGNIGTPLFDLLNVDKNSGNNFPIQGTLTLNELSNKVRGGFNVFKINNEREELLRNVRFSLFLNFNAKDFALNKVLPALTEDISLQINEAIVNVED